PMEEYFAKLGIRYQPIVYYEDSIADRGHGIQYNGQNLLITEVRDRSHREGLMEGDTVVAVNDSEVACEHFPEIVAVLQGVQPRDTPHHPGNRPDGPMQLHLSVGTQQRYEAHVFEVMQNASPQQLALREAWMRRLAHYLFNSSPGP